jgi:polysaccharide export outer membrane protein
MGRWNPAPEKNLRSEKTEMPGSFRIQSLLRDNFCWFGRKRGKIFFWAALLAVALSPHFPPTLFAQEGKGSAKMQGEVGADSSQYVIGPEDVLYINVWNEPALSRSVPVRMDGKISLPLIDEVEAAGLTPLQLKQNLIDRLKKFIASPNVSVTVMEANSFKVYVSGMVRTPGVYRLRNETTILQIIPMAGGFTEWADPKNILIIRKEGKEEKRIKVDYNKIIKGKESAMKYILKAGDTIIVPE